MKKYSVVFSLLLVVVLGWTGISVAQEASVPQELPDGLKISLEPAKRLEGVVDCFDYYKFQSVQVSLGVDKDIYNPGEKVKFQGELINENSYPVVDGYVFARIGRKNDDYTQEGHFTIDEIIPFKDINLDANEKKDVNFDWLIPEGITGGDHQIDFFFSVGKKFNLGGLPFTNEVVIGGAEFKVLSGNASYVSFDKAGTKVNGEKYNHIGSWPQIDPGAKAEIVQPLKNAFSEGQKVNIQYDLYFWDSLNEEDKISSKQEEITISANSSADLNYVVSEMKDSVYLLKITATTQNQKSITNIRLTSNQNHPRLNYPAVTKFPLRKGDSATIFSCFHNTANAQAAGKVSVVLEDKSGKKIGAKEFDGNISGAMMADKKDISVQENYSWVKLTATLKDKDGKNIDQYEAVYDCEKINSSSCKELLAGASQEIADKNGDSDGTKKTIIILVVMLSIISLALIYKHRKEKVEYTNILIFLVIGSFCLFSAPRAEAYNAKTATSSENFSVRYADSIRGGITQGYFVTGVASILHEAEMTKGGTRSQLTRNGYVYYAYVGDEIDFIYRPELPFFNGTGLSLDTPYGAWCSRLSSAACGGTWMEAAKSVYIDDELEIIATVNAIKPDATFSSSNPGVVQCSGTDCVALSPGTSTITANIPQTNLRAFFKDVNNNSGQKKDYFFPQQGTVSVFPDGYEDFSFAPVALSWNIIVTDNPNPVTGACGPAAKTYLPTDPAYSGAFCTTGTQSPVISGLPTAGNDKVWFCNGTPNDVAHRSLECRASLATTLAFDLDLRINKAGVGNGSVSFSPANGSSCSANCIKTYNSGTNVVMTANPLDGSSVSWNSGCSASGNTCSVNMDSDKEVSVTFSKTPPTPQPQDPVPPSEGWKEVAP